MIVKIKRIKKIKKEEQAKEKKKVNNKLNNCIVIQMMRIVKSFHLQKEDKI